MKVRKQTKLWTTQDGNRIRLCDMSDEHLLNTIKFLQRKAKELYKDELAAGYSILSSLGGEAAIDHCEGTLQMIEEEGADYYLPDIYYNMLDEKERRGLIENEKGKKMRKHK